MYTLYYSPGAASLAVHWMLLETGAAYALERVDMDGKQQKTPEYLKLNPFGVVPTLIVDGEPMFESSALVMILAEREARAKLAPAPGDASRATYLQWMLHLANSVQPAFRAWWYPHEPAGEAHKAIAQDAARVRIEAEWDRLDAHLAARGPYMLGASFSAADVFAVMLMRWSRNMPRPATSWPHLNALAELARARPAFKALYEREGLTEWA